MDSIAKSQAGRFAAVVIVVLKPLQARLHAHGKWHLEQDAVSTMFIRLSYCYSYWILLNEWHLSSYGSVSNAYHIISIVPLSLPSSAWRCTLTGEDRISCTKQLSRWRLRWLLDSIHWNSLILLSRPSLLIFFLYIFDGWSESNQIGIKWTADSAPQLLLAYFFHMPPSRGGNLCDGCKPSIYAYIQYMVCV